MLLIAPELGATQSTAVYPKPAYHCCLYVWLSIQPYRGHKELPLSLKSTQGNSECKISFCIGQATSESFQVKRGKNCAAQPWAAKHKKVLCPCFTICLYFQSPVPELIAKAAEAERVHPTCSQRYCPGTVPALGAPWSHAALCPCAQGTPSTSHSSVFPQAGPGGCEKLVLMCLWSLTWEWLSSWYWAAIGPQGSITTVGNLFKGLVSSVTCSCFQ